MNSTPKSIDLSSISTDWIAERQSKVHVSDFVLLWNKGGNRNFLTFCSGVAALNEGVYINRDSAVILNVIRSDGVAQHSTQGGNRD